MGRNKYPEETVAKILDAALELFCAQGYEGPHLIGQWLRLLSAAAQRLVSVI